MNPPHESLLELLDEVYEVNQQSVGFPCAEVQCSPSQRCVLNALFRRGLLRKVQDGPDRLFVVVHSLATARASRNRATIVELTPEGLEAAEERYEIRKMKQLLVR